MRRFVLFGFAFLMMSGGAPFAQSDFQAVQDELKAEIRDYKAKISALAQATPAPSPFGRTIQYPKAKKEPTASLQTGLQGTWWREPYWIKELTLTTDQQKKMDEAFRQNKIKLIDLN